MGECYCRPHKSDEGIEGAQAHCELQVFNRQLRLTEPDSHPATEVPRRCEIWVEHKCAIDEGSAIVEVAGDVGECEAAPGKCNCIILAQFCSQSGEPCS